ncbi:hypothetical protein [Mangrovicoccus sp. HB161399]|uniref:hypothetical protein n=1 Tax=Mangrovicoccus sp. HB161399 TaxID=2720392 RepID=UPI0015571EBA|nr:hypothetical protein [Mangrovicoccus sp. HB161399]
MEGTGPEAASEPPQEDSAPHPREADAAPPTKLDRLRAKLRRLKGEDPDIYPMF